MTMMAYIKPFYLKRTHFKLTFRSWNFHYQENKYFKYFNLSVFFSYLQQSINWTNKKSEISFPSFPCNWQYSPNKYWQPIKSFNPNQINIFNTFNWIIEHVGHGLPYNFDNFSIQKIFALSGIFINLLNFPKKLDYFLFDLLLEFLENTMFNFQIISLL